MFSFISKHIVIPKGLFQCSVYVFHMCIIPTCVSPHAALSRETVWVESRVSWFLLTVLYTQ